MIETNIKSPGVYINEINAFPNAETPIATPIPAAVTGDSEQTPVESEQAPILANVTTPEGMCLPNIATEDFNNNTYDAQGAEYDDLNKFNKLNDTDQLVFPETQPE